MSADAVVFFKQRDIVLAAEKPCGGHARDARSDDGDTFPAHALRGCEMPSSSTALGTGRRSQISPVHESSLRP